MAGCGLSAWNAGRTAPFRRKEKRPGESRRHRGEHVDEVRTHWDGYARDVRAWSWRILLALLILAASCGKDGAPKVTLTDKSCTYSGARTHEPGPFEIEAENTTSHGASFAVFELAPGFSINDVRGFFQRVMVAHDRGEQEVKPPTQDDFTRDAVWSHADPRATALVPVNASAGRFVIVCMENPSADTRPSSQDVWPDPAAIYVPTQLVVR